MNEPGRAEDEFKDLADFLSFEPITENVFRARNFQTNLGGRIFGGSLLAQAVYAAELTVPGRAPHSLHAHFHRPGLAKLPVDHHVTPIRDGVGFSTRRVTAVQNDKPIFEATLSFQVPEEGFEHTSQWSKAPPPPLSVPTLQEAATQWEDRVPHIERRIIAAFGGMETRPLEPEAFLLRRSAPRSAFWIRPALSGRKPVPSHYAGIALVSDYLMPAASHLPHTTSTFSPNLISLSLDHVIWFHAPLAADAWLFCEAESPWAANGRGLNLGRMYSQSGQLIASTAQEQLIRERDPRD